MAELFTGQATGVAEASSLPNASVEVLKFDELNGWATDDHSAALTVFRNTCIDLPGSDWQEARSRVDRATDARSYFEALFRPVLIGGEDPALFTGYFEPQLEGSRHQTDQFRFPVYRLPPEVSGVWLSRAQIEDSNVLVGRGMEIAWVSDAVELFFLQVQGSGRIRLTDGSVIRVGYAGRNGHEYRSVGQELVGRGVFQAHQMSTQAIQSWIRRNPSAGRELLHHNPSYIFFREVEIHDPKAGPLGALDRSITSLRTIAVDPEFTPLGAPVWIEKDGDHPLRRLMVAQDTGSAIKGPQRADIFFGFGKEAGDAAGVIRDPGRMIVLLPVDIAHQFAAGV